MEEINEKQTKKKIKITGAQVAKNCISAALLIALGFGAHCTYDGIKEYSRVNKLIKNYQEENVCLIPKTALTTSCYDMKISSGKKLSNVLIWEDVDFVRIGDEYFTPDGIDISVIEIELTKREYSDIISIEGESGVVYTAPEGFVREGNTYYKDTKETITKVVAKSTVDEIAEFTFDDAVSSTIISITDHQTNTYSSLKDKTFICDVFNTEQNNSTGTYQATLKLVP